MGFNFADEQTECERVTRSDSGESLPFVSGQRLMISVEWTDLHQLDSRYANLSRGSQISPDDENHPQTRQCTEDALTNRVRHECVNSAWDQKQECT